MAGYMKSTRRMIVNDAPPRGRLAQDQREDAGRRFALQLQMESATHQSVIVAEHFDRQFLERELSHLLAFALVLFLIALKGRLPALGLVVAGVEAEFFGFEIALHEAGQVGLVPGDGLIVEHTLDRGVVHRLFAIDPALLRLMMAAMG